MSAICKLVHHQSKRLLWTHKGKWQLTYRPVANYHSSFWVCLQRDLDHHAAAWWDGLRCPKPRPGFSNVKWAFLALFVFYDSWCWFIPKVHISFQLKSQDHPNNHCIVIYNHPPQIRPLFLLYCLHCDSYVITLYKHESNDEVAWIATLLPLKI